MGKESTYNVGNTGSIPGLGRSSEGGHGNLFQYSYMENPRDRGAWRATWSSRESNTTEATEHTHTNDTKSYPESLIFWFNQQLVIREGFFLRRDHHRVIENNNSCYDFFLVSILYQDPFYRFYMPNFYVSLKHLFDKFIGKVAAVLQSMLDWLAIW